MVILALDDTEETGNMAKHEELQNRWKVIRVYRENIVQYTTQLKISSEGDELVMDERYH